MGTEGGFPPSAPINPWSATTLNCILQPSNQKGGLVPATVQDTRATPSRVVRDRSFLHWHPLPSSHRDKGRRPQASRKGATWIGPAIASAQAHLGMVVGEKRSASRRHGSEARTSWEEGERKEFLMWGLMGSGE